jgi:hypothetical protein
MSTLKPEEVELIEQTEFGDDIGKGGEGEE